MEVRLDQSTLPNDQQDIKFQLAIEEPHDMWHKGIYIADREAVRDEKGKHYSFGSDVVRWLPISPVEAFKHARATWNEFSENELNYMAALVKKYDNSDVIPSERLLKVLTKDFFIEVSTTVRKI